MKIDNNNCSLLELKLNVLYYLKLSLRDIFFFESFMWLISLVLTGVVLVVQFAVRLDCLKVLLYFITK